MEADSGFLVLIPARLNATRLPEKVLADLAGKPMVVRVAEQAQQSGAREVVVVVDHPRIAEVVEAHGFRALMTRSDHASGSERLSEAVDLLALDDATRVVNVQGDEPLIAPPLIDALAQHLQAHPELPMSTAAHTLVQWEEWLRPHVVKVVLDARARALYFTRAPVPWMRAHCGDNPWAAAAHAFPASDAGPYRHIGIYAYRAGFLRRYRDLPPSPLEQLEGLEQLRVLWNGYPIGVHLTAQVLEAGVDVPDDLARVRAHLLRNQ